jgi:hypothetical protein
MPDTDSQIRRPQYEERLVALVDVLGLKDDILNAKDDSPPERAWKAIERMQLEISSQTAVKGPGDQIQGTRLTSYHRVLDDGYTTLLETSGDANPDAVELSQFSDHLLLSCKAEGFAPGHMIDRISHFLWAILAGGALVRGAVVVGKIHHSSSRALGPALVRAHQLESEVAVYPRVIVDDAIEVLVDPGRFHTVELPSWVGIPVQRAQPLRRDRDGLLYIDFLRRRLDDGKVHDKMETWQGIRESLVQRRAQHASRPKIVSKYNWMIAYFNDVVREIPQLASLEIGQRPRGILLIERRQAGVPGVTRKMQAGKQ